MIGQKVSAADGSTAIGKDNYAPVVNVHAATGAVVSVSLDKSVAGRRLPSFLAAVISQFAQNPAGLQLGTSHATIAPEISAKLSFNNLTTDCQLIRDWCSYIPLLHKSYQGIEQYNPNVRVLVKRKASKAYEDELLESCILSGIAIENKQIYATQNAMKLVKGVVQRLMIDYSNSADSLLEEEWVDLAISLIVADAVVDCEVLEKPGYVTST